MSQTPRSLIETVVAGRYRVSVWGTVPLPRRIRRMPAGIDPEYVQSEGYEKLCRALVRQKPIGWPVQNHNLYEVESHLRQAFPDLKRVKLVAAQADVIMAAFKRNPTNCGPDMQAALSAFKELWRVVNSRLSESCPKCAKSVKKRLALSGFVF